MNPRGPQSHTGGGYSAHRTTAPLCTVHPNKRSALSRPVLRTLQRKSRSSTTADCLAPANQGWALCRCARGGRVQPNWGGGGGGWRPVQAVSSRCFLVTDAHAGPGGIRRSNSLTRNKGDAHCSQHELHDNKGATAEHILFKGGLVCLAPSSRRAVECPPPLAQQTVFYREWYGISHSSPPCPSKGQCPPCPIPRARSLLQRTRKPADGQVRACPRQRQLRKGHQAPWAMLIPLFPRTSGADGAYTMTSGVLPVAPPPWNTCALIRMGGLDNVHTQRCHCPQPQHPRGQGGAAQGREDWGGVGRVTIRMP